MDEDGRWLLRYTSGLLRQLTLFEGGVLARFLLHRGTLLPDDERDLLHTWLGVRHRMWTVVDYDGEDQMALMEDLLTGARLWVRTPEEPGPPGRSAIALVVPGGGVHHLVGTTLTAPAEHAQALAEVVATADAEAVVRAIGDRLRAALQPKGAAHG